MHFRHSQNSEWNWIGSLTDSDSEDDISSHQESVALLVARKSQVFVILLDLVKMKTTYIYDGFLSCDMVPRGEPICLLMPLDSVGISSSDHNAVMHLVIACENGDLMHENIRAPRGKISIIRCLFFKIAKNAHFIRFEFWNFQTFWVQLFQVWENNSQFESGFTGKLFLGEKCFIRRNVSVPSIISR